MLIIDNVHYLVEKEVQAKYGVTISWLRKVRYLKNGPIYHKLHGKVFYCEKDIDGWFKNNLIAKT